MGENPEEEQRNPSRGKTTSLLLVVIEFENITVLSKGDHKILSNSKETPSEAIRNFADE